MNKKFVVQCEYEDGQLFYWKFFNYGFGGHYLTNDINDAAIFPSTASGQKKIKYITDIINNMKDGCMTSEFTIENNNYLWKSISKFCVCEVFVSLSKEK
jgi:hypothetical protein